MNITLFAFGKRESRPFADVASDYTRRIQRFCSFEICELPIEKGNLPPERRQEKEAEKILHRLPEKAYIIVLDERGKEFDPFSFRDFLRKREEASVPVVVIIGGPFGLSQKILQKANFHLSLAKMTMTADLSRIVFLEYLFRGYTLLKNIPFHH